MTYINFIVAGGTVTVNAAVPVQVLGDALFDGTLVVDLQGVALQDGQMITLFNYNMSQGQFQQIHVQG
jgi:hypothetical protein